jgi:hypothetical protein
LSWRIGVLSGAGVLATHWLTYRMAVPAHHRADVLHTTGHAHWPLLSAAVLALFAAASLRRWAQGPQGGRKPRPKPIETARHLALVQAVVWVAVEVGERAVAGRLTTLDDHPVLLVGLAVQLVVALLGAVLVRLAHHAMTALLGRHRPGLPHRRSQSVTMPATAGRPYRLLPLSGPHGLRGPPWPASITS